MNSKNKISSINVKFKHIMLLIACCCLLVSCNYLDVIPDNIETIEHSFNTRAKAEGYLYGCYSFRLPYGQVQGGLADPAIGSDESWQEYISSEYAYLSNWPSSKIARGEQNAASPILDHWHHLYTGIRECNIFLENIGTTYDVETRERNRWIGEVKFLKAYYHYLLFKRYGPIPIMDVNIPISANVEEVQVYREPVDKVVEYIATTLDDALTTLPEPQQVLTTTEAGRADKLVALTLKAELLLFAASDLFNGNTDMAGVKDNRGISLFPQEKDQNKWRLAADACQAAIAACHRSGKVLYDQVDLLNTRDENPVFQLQSVIRQTICDQWNKELIWGDTKYDRSRLSAIAGTRLIGMSIERLAEVTGEWSPTIKMVEQYYSSNGVPIEHDKDWQANDWYANRYKIREQPSSGDEKYLVEEGTNTVNLHFNREPRFYAGIAFDCGVYYGTSWYVFDGSGGAPRNVKYARFKSREIAGYAAGTGNNITGYGVKKMYSMSATQEYTRTSPGNYFPFPVFRLADLYLMYAEALNEAEGPSDSIFYYLNKIRNRAGLKDLQYCWDNYTNLPQGYYNDQANLREIIRQERAIELAFESKRFWDLRRWKKISEFNTTPTGWNIYGETPEDFYVLTSPWRKTLNLTIKDYFWPIKESNLYVNKNLVQNYGW